MYLGLANHRDTIWRRGAGLHQLLPPHPVTHTLLPPAERGGDGAVEPLAASALANLGKAQAWIERRFEGSVTHALLAAAFHDGLVEGASTAAAKEILAAGAVGPLVDALSRAHLRTQQVRSEASSSIFRLEDTDGSRWVGFAHRSVRCSGRRRRSAISPCT